MFYSWILQKNHVLYFLPDHHIVMLSAGPSPKDNPMIGPTHLDLGILLVSNKDQVPNISTSEPMSLSLSKRKWSVQYEVKKRDCGSYLPLWSCKNLKSESTLTKQMTSLANFMYGRLFQVYDTTKNVLNLHMVFVHISNYWLNFLSIFKNGFSSTIFPANHILNDFQVYDAKNVLNLHIFFVHISNYWLSFLYIFKNGLVKPANHELLHLYL